MEQSTSWEVYSLSICW